MTKLEKDIEQKLRKKVEALGGLCLKWVCPGWSGVPDRIVLLPRARIFFVETKRPKGGELSKLQKKWREWLTRLGFRCWVIWTEEDLAHFLLHIQDERDCRDCRYFVGCECFDGAPCDLYERKDK